MDRLQLPDDRRHPCPACGSEKREYRTYCMVCECNICSDCLVTEPSEWHTSEVELCRECATKELNERLSVLVPACTCDYPAWSHYGQQFHLEVA